MVTGRRYLANTTASWRQKSPWSRIPGPLSRRPDLNETRHVLIECGRKLAPTVRTALITISRMRGHTVCQLTEDGDSVFFVDELASRRELCALRDGRDVFRSGTPTMVCLYRVLALYACGDSLS